jgi:hypothetical protein
MHSSAGETILGNEEEIEIAKQTLKLDRKNYDALYVLSVIYDDNPQTYHLARNIYNDLAGYYPAKLQSYSRMMRFLIKINSNCTTLKDFFTSMPEGVIESANATKDEPKYRLVRCLTSYLAEKRLAASVDKTIATHPESFTYWNFGVTYLELSFYSGNEDKAAKILEEDIPSDFQYWSNGYEVTGLQSFHGKTTPLSLNT